MIWMRRLAYRAAVYAAPAALALSPVVAAAQVRAYTGSRLAMSIDGGPFEAVSDWSGGDPRGKPVAGSTPLQIQGFAYAPLVVDVAIGPPPRFTLAAAGDRILPWLADFLAARDGPHTVDLVAADLAGKITSVSIRATNVRLTEVHTSALDTTAKTPFHLTLVMAPQQTQPFPTGTAITNGLAMTETSVASFRFQLSGVTQERTTRVEPIVFTRAGNGPVQISDIVEDEIFASAGDVLAWRDDFVVQGHNGTTYRRSISLDMLAPDGSSALGLQFSGVGILSAATSEQGAATDAVTSAHVDFFASSVAMTTPAATTSSTTGTTSGSTTGKTGTTDTTTGSTAGATSGAPATTTLGAATHVGPALAPATAGAAGAAAAGASSNPADQGARDPAGVPRLAGLTRTSYSSSRDKTSQTEIANYSTTASVDDTAAAYESALKAAGGWDESSRNEQGDTGKRTHLIILVFRKPQNTLTINVGDLSPTGTTIRVLLATQL